MVTRVGTSSSLHQLIRDLGKHFNYFLHIELDLGKYFQYFLELELFVCLVGFNDTFNTIRLYKRPAKGVLQTYYVLSGNHKTKSAALFRLLIQTKEAPKKRNRTVRVTNT